MIDVPVEEVFAFAADQTNEPRWHTDVLEIHPELVGTGARSIWPVTVALMGRNEYEVEVTALVPNRHVELTTRTGPLGPTTTYRFEPADGGTLFRRHVRIPLGRFRPNEAADRAHGPEAERSLRREPQGTARAQED